MCGPHKDSTVQNRKMFVHRKIPTMTVNDVENIFIEKLTEKYQLTERDLSRAFKKYDLDGSGFLNLEELSLAVHLFIPGVNKELGKNILPWILWCRYSNLL